MLLTEEKKSLFFCPGRRHASFPQKMLPPVSRLKMFFKEVGWHSLSWNLICFPHHERVTWWELVPFCSACTPLCHHKLNIELNTVKWLKCLSTYIWWQVPGVGNTGIQLKRSSYLFNMCGVGALHSCVKQAECLAVAGKFFSPPKSPVFKNVAGWEDGESGHWILAAWRGQTSLPCFVRIHWRELLLEGNAVRWDINENMDRNHSSLSVSVLFVPPEFSLLPTWCCSFETLKHQKTVHFTLTWIDWQGEVAVCKKRPPVGFGHMSYQPVWQPTSQCSHVLQFSAMDDDLGC